MLVKENEFSGTYEEFHNGFKDPAKQAALHKALAAKEYVTTPLDVWQSKYFGGEGEKKKPEAQQAAPQIAATSPAPGLQSGMASEPTDDQGVTILPPEQQKPSVPKASPDELVSALLEKPTEQLLSSYVSSTPGGEYMASKIKTPEQKSQVTSLLYKLDKIRNQPGDNVVKLAKAQREIALAAETISRDASSTEPFMSSNAFVNQYVQTVAGMEKSSPEAYKQLMDDRVEQSAVSRNMPEKQYRAMLDQRGLRAAYGAPQEGEDGEIVNSPEFREADLRLAIRAIEGRDYSYAADSPQFVAEKKAQDAAEIQQMTAEAEQLRANRLSEFDGAIEAAKKAMAIMPGVQADNAVNRKIAQLEKERGYLLNPSKQVSEVYAAYQDEIKTAPGKTPLEKMQNHFQRLAQEQGDLWEAMSKGGQGEFATRQLDQMFTGTDAVNARYGEVTKQLKALAPVVALNEAAIKDDSFTSRILPAMFSGMYGGVVAAEAEMTKQDMASNMLLAMQVAGVSEKDLQPGALEMTKKRLESYGLGDGAYWGELLGSSAGVAIPLMAGGAATAPMKAPRIIASKPLLNLVFNAAKTGASYELSGQVFQNQAEELNFLSGFMGGIGGEVAGGAMKKMGAKAVGAIFGDKTPEAINAIARFGAASAGSGVGETVEEFAQTITQIAQQSSTFEQFQKKFSEQFPDWSAAANFAISTMVMGMGMGIGNNVGIALAKNGQQLIDDLPADEAVAVKTALQQLAEESTGATQEMVAEAQAELEMTPEEKVQEQAGTEVAAEEAAISPSPVVEPTGESVTAPATTEVAGQPVESAEAVASPTMEESTPAAELVNTVKEIAGANPEDVKLLSEGFSGLFGEEFEIDIAALESQTAPEAAVQQESAAGAPVTQDTAKPKRERKKPTKVEKPESVIDDAKNEEVAPSPEVEKAADQRVEKLVENTVKETEAKRPRQKAVEPGQILTEYKKLDPGAYRLTEYRKDDKGNWLYRNAKVGTTPSTKKREYMSDWQPVADTPQAKDNIERLAASPVRTDLKNAIEELKSEVRGMFRMSAIDDPVERAKQQKRVIDAAVNVGAAFIRAGVTDLKDWTAKMAEIAKEFASQPKFAEMIYNTAKSRVAAEQQPPIQQEKPKVEPAPAPQPEPRQQAPVQPAPQVKATPTKIRAAEGEGELKERGAVTSMREEQAITPEIEAQMSAKSKKYRVRNQAQVAAEVKDHIEKYGVKGVKEAVMDFASDMPFDSRVVAAKAIMQHYKEASKTGTEAEKKAAMKSSAEMASFLAEFGTMMGQGIAAMDGWMDGLDAFGPEFMVQYATKYVSNVRTEALKRTKGVDSSAREAIESGSSLAALDAANSQRVQDAIESQSSGILMSTKEQLAERKAAALAKFRAAVGKAAGSSRTGIDLGATLDATAALAEYGVILVAEGVVNFKDWAKRVKADLGDISDADLEKAWKTSTPDGSPESVSERMRAATRLANMLKDPKPKGEADPMANVARMVRDKVRERVPKKLRDKVSIVAEAVVNADKYADVWRAAVIEAERAIDESSATDQAKADKKKKLRDAVEETIGKPFTDAQVRAAINASLRESGTAIKDLLEDDELAASSLERITEAIKALGVPEESSEKIAKAFKAEYESMLAKKRKEALIRSMGKDGKQYFGIVDNLGTANPTDAEWRAMMSKKYDLPEMTEKDVNEIIELAKVAAELPENSHQRAKAAAKVLGRIGKIEKIDKGGVFWDYYYANMLSGPMTHARNIAGNFYNLASELMVSAIEQTIASGDPKSIFQSFVVVFRGLTQMGSYSAFDAVVSGTASKGGKFENPGTMESIGKDSSLALWTISRWKYVTRILAGQDMFFYHGFRALRMSEIIRSDGHAKGLRGAALRKYVNEKMFGTKAQQEAAQKQVEMEAKKFGLKEREQKIRYQEILSENHPKIWKDKAEDYGSFGTFNYAPKGVLGTISDAINSVKQGKKGGRKPGQWINLIVPFTRVPANILNQQLSYTPWGFYRLMSKSKSEDFGLTNRQERNRELIKAIIGTMYMGVIPMLLAAIFSGDDDDGNPRFAVHGAGPADWRKRAFLEASGWRPNTIQIGSTFYPFEGTAISLPLSMTGNILDMMRYGKPSKGDMADEAWKTTATIMGTVFNRSFLTNMGDLLETLGKGERAGDALKKMLVRTTATVIPAYPFTKQMTSMIDDTKYKANRFFKEYVSGIGFVRDWAGVKPELDVFGRPKKLRGNAPLEVLVENIERDPVMSTMVKHDLWYSPISKATTIDGIPVDDDELYALTEKSGPRSLAQIQAGLPGWVSRLESASKESLPLVKEDIQKEIDEIRSDNIDIAKTEIPLTPTRGKD